MINFRYHALSLVAVFLALAIGVVLGVAIGDKGVVSGARRDLEQSLRGDLDKARERNADLDSQLSVRDDYERQAYPRLVRGMLRGQAVGMVAIGNLPTDYVQDVSSAIGPAGARLVSVDVVAAPLPLRDIAGDLSGTRYSRLRSKRQVRRFGRSVGRQIAAGGELPQRVRHSLFSSSRGEVEPLDAVVLVRDREGLKGRQAALEDAFEDSLIAGLKRSKSALAAVERQDTDPSQVGFFKDKGISTVDDVDLVAGHAALVYVLAGAEGQFGTGGGKLLPRRPRTR